MWKHKLRTYRSTFWSRWWRRDQQNRSARVSSSRSRTRFFIPMSGLLLAFSCLLGFVFMLQKPGLSYAAPMQSGFAACTPTEGDWCYRYDFEVSNGGFTQSPAEWVSGSGWEAVNDTSIGYRMVGINKDLLTASYVRFEMEYTVTSRGSNVGANTDWIQLPPSTRIVQRAAAGYTGALTLEAIGTYTADNFGLVAVLDEGYTYGGDAVITALELEGTGSDPYLALLPTPTPTPTPRQIISQANTPTMTPTGAVISDTLPTHVPSWTPDAVCPSGANPYGWGRITPDPLWIMQCAQCVHIARTPYPTYAPDSSGSGTYNFYNRCTVVVPQSVGNVNPRGDPKTFYLPGMDLSEPECLTFQEWTVSFLDPVIGIEDVGLPEISICIISVTFGNIVFFGYIIPVDEILGTIVGMRVLFWFFFGRGGA